MELLALYALVAAPLLATVLKASLDRSKPLHDVLALGLLAACIVAPYGRHYDFPVLLIPLFVLLGTRLSEIVGAVLLVALLLLPYSQYWIMARRGLVSQIGRPSPEFLFAWVPLLLAGVWLTTAFQRSRRALAACNAASREGPRLVAYGSQLGPNLPSVPAEDLVSPNDEPKNGSRPIIPRPKK